MTSYFTRPHAMLSFVGTLSLVATIVLMSYVGYLVTHQTILMQLESMLIDVMKVYYAGYDNFHYLIPLKNTVFFVRLIALFGMIIHLLTIDRLSKVLVQDSLLVDVIQKRLVWSKIQLMLLFSLLCVAVFI